MLIKPVDITDCGLNATKVADILKADYRDCVYF